MTPIERARALRRDYDDLTQQAQETGHYSAPPAEMVVSPSLPSVDHWGRLREGAKSYAKLRTRFP